MWRDERLYLEDIAQSCEKILRYSDGLDFSSFQADEMAYDAVLRNLQIIGEAVKNLSPSLRDDHPQIDWRRIAGLRDVVTHHYFGVNDDVVWDVVQTKVPELLSRIREILAGGGPGPSAT